MENDTKLTLIRQDKSSSLLNTLPVNDDKDISAKDFAQSCTYQVENMDRKALIKRQDMESCLKRLSTRNNVCGVIVATIDGHILYECDALKNWVPALAPLCIFARHLTRSHDPHDNIRALRLRTKTYEVLITFHAEQILIVMQLLSNNSKSKDKNIDNAIEEDWEALLKRIQQTKTEHDL